MRSVLFALLLSASLAGAQEIPVAQAVPRSTVYFTLEPNVIRGASINRTIVQRMVDSLVVAATQKPTPAQAWASLVTPKDVVGVKVSTGGGATSGTHPEVVEAIVNGLLAAGVPPSRIIVWDKNYGDLIAAGFKPDAANYRLRWIDAAKGYDPDAVLTAPVLGKLIWGDSKFGRRDLSRKVDLLSGGDQLSSQSFYARVLSKEVTKVINVPSLQDSFLTGVNGALASMTIQNIDNWRRFTREPMFGDPYVAEIYADPIIYDKVVLTFLDALYLQFAGGPFPNPNFAVPYHSIFVSRDPVAIDATARRLIDEQRLLNKLPALKEQTLYLESAQQMGLGNDEDAQINLVRIGVEGFR